MTRVTSLAAAFGVALALGACAGEGGQLATSPEAPAFQTGGVGPACNLTDLRKATSALFGTKDAANDIAKQFTSKNQNSDKVLPFAYNLFEKIEAKRSTAWTTGDPAKGAELALQIIACSPVDYTDDLLEGTDHLASARSAFEGALDFAGFGTFAVRGGQVDEFEIASKNLQAGLRAPQNLEAPDDFATWFGGVGNRSLVIGYRIYPIAFTTENDDADFFYEWSLVRPVPSNTLSGLAAISYCASNSLDLTELPEQRIQHLYSGAGGTILPLANKVGMVVCNGALSARRGTDQSLAMRMLDGLFGLVRPAPLFASVVLKGPVSGTLGDFSPTGVVDPEATVMSFTVQPTGGTTNTDLPVEVRITGSGGTPWAGITVKLTAFENNGVTLAPCNTVAVTDDDGRASFPNFQINKPGTVHLTATTVATGEGIASSYLPVSVTSNDFVVTGAGNAACIELSE